jgi:hypothetical protein
MVQGLERLDATRTSPSGVLADVNRRLGVRADCQGVLICIGQCIACHRATLSLHHPSRGAAPAMQLNQPGAPSISPFPSTRRCTPVRLSSYAATPFAQDEDIINGTLEITISISGERFDFIRLYKTPDTGLPAIASFAKSCHRFPLSGTNEGQKWKNFKNRVKNRFRPPD